MADDFNYDDEAKIDVTDNNWDDGTAHPGVGVEFDNTTTGISQVGKDTADVMKVYRCGSDVVIVSATDTVIPVYRVGSSVVQMLHLLPGVNNFNLTRGIYIIKARKYVF